MGSFQSHAIRWYIRLGTKPACPYEMDQEHARSQLLSWRTQSFATSSCQENNMTVAEKLSVKQWDASGEYHTSKLNKTPPMGDPKATDIPAAAAAESTSRFRARPVSINWVVQLPSRTFIAVNAVKEFHEKVRTATRHMDEWPFLTKPHTRCNGKTLQKSVKAFLSKALTYQSKWLDH